jgi:hypothetical protein
MFKPEEKSLTPMMDLSSNLKNLKQDAGISIIHWNRHWKQWRKMIRSIKIRFVNVLIKQIFIQTSLEIKQHLLIYDKLFNINNISITNHIQI